MTWKKLFIIVVLLWIAFCIAIILFQIQKCTTYAGDLIVEVDGEKFVRHDVQARECVPLFKKPRFL